MLVSCLLLLLAWAVPGTRPTVEVLGLQALICIQAINIFVGYPFKEWLISRFKCPGSNSFQQHLILDMIFMPLMFGSLVPDSTREHIFVGLIWLSGLSCLIGAADGVFTFFGQPLLYRGCRGRH